MGLHERRLAGRPGDRPVRPERDMIDPAVLCVGRQRAAFAIRIGLDHLAIVAAADDALAVGGRGEDRAAMHRDATRLAVRLGEQQRFLAEHEHGGAAEKMRADDGRARRHRVRAFDDGDGIAAGIGHETRLTLLIPSPLWGGGGVRIVISANVTPLEIPRQ